MSGKNRSHIGGNVWDTIRKLKVADPTFARLHDQEYGRLQVARRKKSQTGLVEAVPSLEKVVGPLTFGMFVRAARTRLDLSRVEAAERIGVSYSRLRAIENGKSIVLAEVARNVARGLGDSEELAVHCCFADQLRQAGMSNWSATLERQGKRATLLQALSKAPPVEVRGRE